MVKNRLKMLKRCQTATEYLIILAVVIIIALIVVGVLGGIPGIGGSSRGSAADAYWQTSEVGISAYAFSETGDDSITLKNNRPSSIVITDVRIHPTLATVSTTDNAVTLFNVSGTGAYGPSVANQTLAAGGTYKYTNGTSLTTFFARFGSGTSGSWTQLDCTAGETYSFYIEVDYEDVPTGATYTFDGSDTPIEGTCAN